MHKKNTLYSRWTERIENIIEDLELLENDIAESYYSKKSDAMRNEIFNIAGKLSVMKSKITLI